MLELPTTHFDRVIPLFDAGQPNSTMIFSTLAGRTLGRAFVDNLDNPANCLLVMDGDVICSEAYAVFLGAGKFEIGIVTNQEYRKQGYAYLACKGLLQLVEATGYPPRWSYFGGNVGSAATARKLGFGGQREYQWFSYPQVV